MTQRNASPARPAPDPTKPTGVDLPQRVAELRARNGWTIDELARYAAFCRSPDAIDDAALADLLTAFLCHVPEHLAAAGRLHTGLPLQDIFGVGAVEPNER